MGEENKADVRTDRQTAILTILTESGPNTTGELAEELFRQGIIPQPKRKHVRSAISALGRKNQIAVVGSKRCERRGRELLLWGAVGNIENEGE